MEIEKTSTPSQPKQIGTSSQPKQTEPSAKYKVGYAVLAIIGLIIIAICVVLYYFTGYSGIFVMSLNDLQERKALNYLNGILITCYVTLIVLVLFIILLSVFTASIKIPFVQGFDTFTTVEYFTMAILIAASLIIGILAALCAYNLTLGPNFSANNEIYIACCWVAGVSLGTLLLASILIIVIKFCGTDETDKTVNPATDSFGINLDKDKQKLTKAYVYD